MNRQQRRAQGYRGPLLTREQRKEGMGDVDPPQPSLAHITFEAWPQWKAQAHAAPAQCPVAFWENALDWGTKRLRTVTARQMRIRRMRLCTDCANVVLEARYQGSQRREFQRAELAMKRERKEA